MKNKYACDIKDCNNFAAYTYLKLCKKHYATLNGKLKWPTPSLYMTAKTAKDIIEKEIKYEEL